jgi:hypothetical protein
VISDARQPRIGFKRLGYVEYAFRDDGVDVEVVEPSALVNHDLDTVWPPARQLNQSPATTQSRRELS